MTPGELNHVASHLGLTLSGIAGVMAAISIIPRFAVARRAGTWRVILTPKDRSMLTAAVIFGIAGIFPFAVLLYVVKLLLDRSPPPTKRPKIIRKAPLFREKDPNEPEFYRNGRPQGGNWGYNLD